MFDFKSFVSLLNTLLLLVFAVIFIILMSSCSLINGRSQEEIDESFKIARQLNIGGLGNIVLTKDNQAYIFYSKYSAGLDTSKCVTEINNLLEQSQDYVIETLSFLDFISYITKEKYNHYFCPIEVFTGFYLINSQDLNTIYDSYIDLIGK